MYSEATMDTLSSIPGFFAECTRVRQEQLEGLWNFQGWSRFQIEDP